MKNLTQLTSEELHASRGGIRPALYNMWLVGVIGLLRSFSDGFRNGGEDAFNQK